MFEKLRSAFSNAAKSFGERELKEDDIDEVLFEMEISLMDADVASEVINSVRDELKKKIAGAIVSKKTMQKFVRDSMVRFISKLFDDAGTVDLLKEIRDKQDSADPYIVSFVGINGTGKTTTVAKIAHLLKNSKISVAIAASDTFRAGAIEQLREHANRLNLKIIAQNYGADPAAVARDAVLYARSHKVDCVLIDTAGRMQTSKNLMEQIKKITSVVKPDLTIFVGDSLAGNDTVNQARQFHENAMFDASILTKSDADARGGAALSIVKVTSSPIIFIGTGQEYGDLIPFDKEVFLKTVFGSIDEIDSEAALRKTERVQKAKEESGESAKQQDRPAHQDEQKDAKTAGENRVQEPKLVQKAGPAQETESAQEQKLAGKAASVQEPAQAKPSQEADEMQKRPPKPDLSQEQKSSQEPEYSRKVEPSGTQQAKQSQDAARKNAADSASKQDSQKKTKAGAELPEQRRVEESEDAFEGIETGDIALYSDLYDVPPPENDSQAASLAKRIRRWISDGRPAPGQEQKPADSRMRKPQEKSGDAHKSKDSAKPKKKKGLFGRFRR